MMFIEARMMMSRLTVMTTWAIRKLSLTMNGSMEAQATTLLTLSGIVLIAVVQVHKALFVIDVKMVIALLNRLIFI